MAGLQEHKNMEQRAEYPDVQTVPIIIPAYEPSQNLLNLADEIACPGFAGEDVCCPVVIIDDGSGENYRGIFEKAGEKGCIILEHCVNMGKGRGLKNAFNYSLNRWKNLTGAVTADSDGQHTAEDIRKCVRALLSHPQSLILGCRMFDGENVPWKSRFGNVLTRRICRYLCGIQVSDTQTGLRGIPGTFMKTLLNTGGERFEYETNMLIETNNRVSIVEIPIQTIYESKDNHQTHFDPVKDSIRIYRIFGAVFIKYIFSSFSSSVIDLVLFGWFCSLLINTGAFYAAAATVMARIISSAYNYAVSYCVVFRSKRKKTAAAGQYFLLVLIQMFLSAALITAGIYLFPYVPQVLLKAAADTALFFLSYKIQQAYIF